MDNNNFNFDQEPLDKPDPFFEVPNNTSPVPPTPVETTKEPTRQTADNRTIPENSLRDKFINGAKIALAMIISAACVYFFLTAPAYYVKVKYLFSAKPQTAELTPQGKENSTVTLAEVQQNPATNQNSSSANNSSPSSTGSTLTLADLTNNTLIIPKIDIKVPIIWNSPADDETMLSNLQNGVVQYGSTALPGTGKGPIFISGHSSYYWWDKGLYKTVFANLDQVDVNDEIALAYNDIVYIYKVFEKKTVNPDDVEVLNPVNEPILSLMTCVPVGTNLQRLIINAKQISPGGSEVSQLTQNSTPTKVDSSSSQNTQTSSAQTTNGNEYLLPEVK